MMFVNVIHCHYFIFAVSTPSTTFKVFVYIQLHKKQLSIYRIMLNEASLHIDYFYFSGFTYIFETIPLP